ncbi:hybrid sensor histidine kinase/response regulator [Candidatus Protochlamydia phocaeensis]|uniref:hybrid sensor histidine kinase/response regulator n=1 Tax=Candidatus Protochlamydia phocaeensis TaxID=1414722 RepID=UPI000ABBCEFE|nr:hybrid sensor histidine kinase/response regulator [Candidatus Protochlamydia phocaeensis]
MKLEDYSKLKEIQREMKALANHLRDILVPFHNHAQVAEAIEMAIQGLQALLSLIEATFLDSLIPFMRALDQYLKAMQKGMSMKAEHLEMLSIVSAKLIQMAEVDSDKLERLFYNYLFSFESWTSPLRTAAQTHERVSSRAAALKEKFSNEPLLREERQSQEVDQPLIEISLQEFRTITETLSRLIIVLGEEPRSSLALLELLKTVRIIKHIAQVIQFPSLLEIGEAWERHLSFLTEGKGQWNQQSQEVLSDTLDLLSGLVHLSPEKLEGFIQKHKEIFKEIIQKLARLQADDSQKEKTGPVPAEPAPVTVEIKEEPRPIKEEAIHKVEVPAETAIEGQEGSKPAKEKEEGQELSIDPIMFDLFRTELETQCKALNQGLLELESHRDPSLLEMLMRAAHSIKGAARVISLSAIIQMAHAMEDCFVGIQKQQIELDVERIDYLLQMVDLLTRLSKINLSELYKWLKEQDSLIANLIKQVSSLAMPLMQPQKKIIQAKEKEAPAKIAATAQISLKEMPKKQEVIKVFPTTVSQNRILRVNAQSLNRLMGLAGESLVESRWLSPFENSLQKLKRQYNKLSSHLDELRQNLKENELSNQAQDSLTTIQHEINEIRYQLTDRLDELDNFIRRHASLSDRLYQEVINSRMRPFGDGVEGFPRMVRDLARQLGKKIKLEIIGQSTPVDRDILERLESPLSHLLRNACDHGIEPPQERLAAGKPPEGVIKLEAHHRGGILVIIVTDDGRGIDIRQLRKKIVEKNFISDEMAGRLEDSEVIDFLFLPGFSTAKEVTEISGRGIGLDVVRSTVQEVGGIVKTFTTIGKGTSFQLQLPLTLSVIRALLVEISGEIYAFPLARIDKAIFIDPGEIESVENRPYFRYEGQNIGLISAWQVLELDQPRLALKRLPIIILNDLQNCYGLIVDRLIEERELVVQELDSRLGKTPDIIAGALMENGMPVLIIDVEDIVRSIDLLLSGGRLANVSYANEPVSRPKLKRILIVDDSLTVREVECRLLQNQGYEVETAVNGIDGWNAVRIGHYDLVITDVDMPRMDGIELVKAIKKDPHLKNLPVLIVSYKEGEEDRVKGLEAGADYYLTKSSFHDATLLEAVYDLIGQPVA